MAQLVYISFRENIVNEAFTDLVDMKYDHPIKVSKPHFKLKDFDKVSQLIQICNNLKSTYKKDHGKVSPELFQLAEEQLRLLNRIFENRTNWMIPVIYQSSEQLFSLAKTLENSSCANHNDEGEEESFLIKTSRTIHMALNICFKDRNENKIENKKAGIFHFATLLFKIYLKIQAYGLLNNMCKVFESRLTEIDPYLKAIQSNVIGIKFQFYMGLYYGYEKNNYELGCKWLEDAWKNCVSYQSYPITYPIRKRVLLYLIPMKFLKKKHYPHLKYLQIHYPDLYTLYKPMVTAIFTGQLYLFETFLAQNEYFLVINHLYMPILSIKPFIHLKLIKTVSNTLNSTKQPIQIMDRAIQFASRDPPSKSHTSIHITNDTLDNTECVLASLIAKGYIKGYLSHSHRVMMTSKAQPFPKLST